MAAAIADEDNHDDDLKDLEIAGVKLGETYHNAVYMRFKRSYHKIFSFLFIENVALT